MDSDFYLLESSLRLEEPLFGHDNIEHLYRTYVASMDTFPSASGCSGSSSPSGNDNFQSVSVDSWRGEDCVDWASSVCRRRGLDHTTVDLWSLNSTSGSLLVQFSLHDFCSILGDENLGRLFYKEFRSLVKKRKGERGQTPHTQDPTWSYTEDDLLDLNRYIPEASGWDDTAGQNDLQDLEINETFMPIKYEEYLSEPQHQPLDYHDQQDYYHTSYTTTPLTSPSPIAGMSSPSYASSPTASSIAATSDSDVFKKIPTNTRRRERGPKSWEFLVRLLADKGTNPSVIRWEEESEATFRLNQPDVIARMWGARSGKPNLSYVNFARGLRYHYNTGALEAVSERQLVYRCGPKALEYLSQLQQGGGQWTICRR